MFSIRHPHFLPRNPAVSTLLTEKEINDYCFKSFLAWMGLAYPSLLIRGLCHLFDYYPPLLVHVLVGLFLIPPMAFIISALWPKIIYYYHSVGLYIVGFPQKHEASAYIDKLPKELFDIIISEYSKTSIDPSNDMLRLEQNSPMNFILVSHKWKDIGQSSKQLFRANHLFVNGHEQLQKLLSLYYWGNMPSHITSLTVNLAPAYPQKGYRRFCGVKRVMVQVQQDFDALQDLRHGATEVPTSWNYSNLRHFTLIVDVSAVSAQKPLLTGFIWHEVSLLVSQWRESGLARGWTGSDGFHGEVFYSYRDL